MIKRKFFYEMMMVISIIILIAGIILCIDENAAWDVQMAQITSGMDISPVFWTDTRILGVAYLLGGILNLIGFGILTVNEFD